MTILEKYKAGELTVKEFWACGYKFKRGDSIVRNGDMVIIDSFWHAFAMNHFARKHWDAKVFFADNVSDKCIEGVA